MKEWLDTILISILLINLLILGTSRLGTFVKIVALQGLFLAMLPWMLHEHTVHTWIICVLILAIKGWMIPHFMFHTIRKLHIRREIEPFIGFTPSLVLGMGFILLAFWIGDRLELPFPVMTNLLVPAAIATLLTGLMMLVSRRKAATQVLGYVVLENGIFIFALALASEMPVTVEAAILLDVFALVFIMGITLNHIKDMFEDVDIVDLTNLRG